MVESFKEININVNVTHKARPVSNKKYPDKYRAFVERSLQVRPNARKKKSRTFQKYVQTIK